MPKVTHVITASSSTPLYATQADCWAVLGAYASACLLHIGAASWDTYGELAVIVGLSAAAEQLAIQCGAVPVGHATRAWGLVRRQVEDRVALDTYGDGAD